MAWAMGTIHQLVRQSTGDLLSEIKIPKPTVTADTPKGSVAARSKKRLIVSCLVTIVMAHTTPKHSAIAVAINA